MANRAGYSAVFWSFTMKEITEHLSRSLSKTVISQKREGAPFSFLYVVAVYIPGNIIAPLEEKINRKKQNLAQIGRGCALSEAKQVAA